MRYSNQIDGCPVWPGYPGTGFWAPDERGLSPESIIAVKVSPRVGSQYAITVNAKMDLEQFPLTGIQKARLTSIIVGQRIHGEEWPRVTSEMIRQALKAQPLPVQERVDRLYKFIAKRSPEMIGEWINLDRETRWSALAWSDSTELGELDYLLEELKKQNLIEINQLPINDAGFRLRLTFEGHRKSQEHTSLIIPPETVQHGLYDFFICHANEDKEDFVRSLAQTLLSAGAKVWYDEFTLRLGDSLREKIDQGLNGSRFGVVVLSESFFQKGWPQAELNGLFNLQTQGQSKILPIRHKISADRISKFSPLLADRFSWSTDSNNIREIASGLMTLIRGDSHPFT